jgi:hypothetical protein
MWKIAPVGIALTVVALVSLIPPLAGPTTDGLKPRVSVPLSRGTGESASQGDEAEETADLRPQTTDQQDDGRPQTSRTTANLPSPFQGGQKRSAATIQGDDGSGSTPT